MNTLLALLMFTGLATAAPLAPGAMVKDCERCPEMVVVPSGTFNMGTPRGARIANETGESPPVKVAIGKPLLIGRYEVTRAEFEIFARETSFWPKVTCRIWNQGRNRYEDDERTWREPGIPTSPLTKHPVTCVSWDEAKAFTAWLTRTTGKPYRLLSAAEWEYAARAGSQDLYPWGPDASGGCRFANLYDITARKATPQARRHAACVDGFAGITTVGSLAPNAFGLYDMIGNVAEWTEDCATRSHIGRPPDGRPWKWAGCARVIQRGGGGFTSTELARPGYQADVDPGERSDFSGFRVARDLTAEER